MLTRMPAGAPVASELARTPAPSMVTDLVTITTPKPPGSTTLMMPPRAVLYSAPANVLHGSTRPHSAASSPSCDTQVLTGCWGKAAVGASDKAAQSAAMPNAARAAVTPSPAADRPDKRSFSEAPALTSGPPRPPRHSTDNPRLCPEYG